MFVLLHLVIQFIFCVEEECEVVIEEVDKALIQNYKDLEEKSKASNGRAEEVAKASNAENEKGSQALDGKPDDQTGRYVKAVMKPDINLASDHEMELNGSQDSEMGMEIVGNEEDEASSKTLKSEDDKQDTEDDKTVKIRMTERHISDTYKKLKMIGKNCEDLLEVLMGQAGKTKIKALRIENGMGKAKRLDSETEKPEGQAMINEAKKLKATAKKLEAAAEKVVAVTDKVTEAAKTVKGAHDQLTEAAEILKGAVDMTELAPENIKVIFGKDAKMEGDEGAKKSKQIQSYI